MTTDTSRAAVDAMLALGEKITPGKWWVEEYANDYWPGIEASGLSIVIFGIRDDDRDEAGIRGNTHEEAVANARALASVPAMLALIRALADRLDTARANAFEEAAKIVENFGLSHRSRLKTIASEVRSAAASPKRETTPAQSNPATVEEE